MIPSAKKYFQPLKNQKGMLSADFLFSMILACLLSMMLLALASTYSVVEIAQYVAFSAARAHASADVEISDQKRKAAAKFAQLVNNPVLKPLLQSEHWFHVSLKDIKSGGNTATGGNPQDNYGDQYPVQIISAEREMFIPAVGLRLDFEAKILNMRLGQLGNSGDNEGAGFHAIITGFLIREPTQKECQDLMTETNRYQKIIGLDGRFSNILSKNGNASGKYIPMEDNGC